MGETGSRWVSESYQVINLALVKHSTSISVQCDTVSERDGSLALDCEVTHDLKFTPADSPSSLWSDTHTCLTCSWPCRFSSNSSEPISVST